MSSLHPGIPDIKALSLGGSLSVFGNGEDNTIEISRAENKILVNDGDVRPFGNTPTVENTKVIQAFGLGGNDVITLDETNGALPNANLFGGAGDDIITGGSGNDLIFGQSGNDNLFGKGGDDLLFGGSGDDILTGGNGTDQMFGEAGDDRMIWNPGEGSDLMEGGEGEDVAEVNGGNGAENFTIVANGDRVSFDRVSPAPFNLDIGTTEVIELNANGGDDVVTAGNGLAALTSLVIDGGDGNDTINSGDGADLLYGGAGNDFIDGNRGNDTAFMGEGDDVFQWDPGDGSDVVEGGEGTDTLLFNGANAAENIDISANGERATFFRDVANITMDNDDVERFDFNALGGEDNVVVNDMSGTDVTEVNVDLAATIGGTEGDAAVDTVRVKGTEVNDAINVSALNGTVVVAGLAANVTVEHAEATDVVHIEGLGGDDVISAGNGLAPLASLVIDGGDGNDTINSGDGADLLYGGAGNDFIDGNRGNDTAFMGEGDDVFQWDPGDGSDVVEGGEGTDTLLFNGANAAENIDISANGERATFFRDVANITMDNDDVERFDFNALGGEDNVVVNDMSGTDVTEVNVDLAATIGGAEGDAAVDTVRVKGTEVNDAINVSALNGTVVVAGLAANVTVEHAEATDVVHIEGLGGDDVISAGNGLAPLASLVIDGGDGNDTINSGDGADLLYGGAGNDFIDGNRGNDTAFMGEGDDVFQWDPGDGSDVVEGGEGTDTLLFNGANAAENIDISANGERATFFRDVANITMDNDDVERFDFNALGGEDRIVVNDMSGTDVTEVNLDLAATIGGTQGDAADDEVIVNGTNGDDVIVLSLDNGSLIVDGLATRVVIEHFDFSDTLNIQGLGGNDVIDASAIADGGMRLSFDGGEGDDVLIGSGGDDSLFGGNGDDVLLGGLGTDALDGGSGDNILIQ